MPASAAFASPSVLAPSPSEAATSCRPDLLIRSRIKLANSLPFMGVDKLSSTPCELTEAPLDKGLATLAVDKFRLLSMLFPCSLFVPRAANCRRAALY